MMGLLVLAAAVMTCPGGPVFVFEPGKAVFTAQTDQALPDYLPNLNSKLWREGWFTVEPVVRDTTDRAALALVRRRERAIAQRMHRLGIDRTHIRFGVTRSASPSDGAIAIDEYLSTLSVPQAIYDRLVAPGLLC